MFESFPRIYILSCFPPPDGWKACMTCMTCMIRSWFDNALTQKSIQPLNLESAWRRWKHRRSSGGAGVSWNMSMGWNIQDIPRWSKTFVANPSMGWCWPVFLCPECHFGATGRPERNLQLAGVWSPCAQWREDPSAFLPCCSDWMCCVVKTTSGLWHLKKDGDLGGWFVIVLTTIFSFHVLMSTPRDLLSMNINIHI